MKKRLYPVFSLVLALALCLGLSGCQAPEPGPGQSAPAVTAPAGETPSPSPEAPLSAPEDQNVDPEGQSMDPAKGNTESLDENGSYDSAEDVALYLRLYDQLPDNYITKNEARDLGWSGGSVEEYAPGKCIGGDVFGNREGLLPKANGRTWTECDIDTLGEDGRGAKRLVFSNDGLIYYTDDHYETFERIYPEE